MATILINNPRFDAIEYVKKLRNAGMSQEIAEIQGQELEHIIDALIEQTKQAIDNKELATKGDIRESELRLQKEIEILRSELKTDIKSLEIKILALYGAGFLVLLGILAKGFHWF